jgi:hypothetical protein
MASTVNSSVTFAPSIRTLLKKYSRKTDQFQVKFHVIPKMACLPYNSSAKPAV